MVANGHMTKLKNCNTIHLNFVPVGDVLDLCVTAVPGASLIQLYSVTSASAW